ncbi:alpha-mannosidase 2C1-like isoform X2 [Centruroides vittatus]|uniref:alpha-mannosidase 2C1-like isoform X2 n=1 Tax=Centruroides vittatus TaxID=120091 RepID=UPI00350F6A54
MAAIMKNKRTTTERIEKFISSQYFTDANLYGKLYPSSAQLSYLSHFAASGRVPFKESVEMGHFVETKPGSSFGPTWSTHWFKMEIQIPDSWLGKEVHLRWDAGCEAMVWSNDGLPLQGLSSERKDFIISYNVTLEDLRQTYYIEMACNTLIGAGKPTMISPPDPDHYFTLNIAEIAVFDRQVYNLIIDLEVMLDMVKNLSSDNPRGYDAMHTANEMINIIQTNEGSTDSFDKARHIAKLFFSQRNGNSQHTILAVGNCHIDCAWLWPYEETVRKCARSWASVIRLMEKYSDFNFACSQAQQFMWVKENYPSLYERVRYFVAKGRFIPVGGTWVEMDGNLPSGESFIRQFLYGQRFFEQEFGRRCKEFWLPDTFGYSAQLPQIMKLCGIKRFLTQKLSWNLVNKFPHDNFLWEGVDGSTVLVHFPPSESYTSSISVSEVLDTVKNLKDKGRVTCSMMLFGHGDGGGGPTEDMLERQRRLEDVDGIPKVKHSTPDCFFSHVEKYDISKLCRWVGELYLELHNATYTTQAKMKQLNRECEFLLRNAELFHSILLAASRDEEKKAYPELEIERLWKILLLNQFHDVLPGSSIGEVHKEAAYYFVEVQKSARSLVSTAIHKLFGLTPGTSDEDELVMVNVLSWPRTELIHVPWPQDKVSRRVWIEGIGKAMQCIRTESGEGTLVPVVVGPMGYQLLRGISATKISVSLEQRKDGCFVIRNQYIEATIDEMGCLLSLILQGCRKEAISPGCRGNHFVLFDDIPLYWDAWDVMDYHLETRRSAVSEITKSAKIVENGPLRASLKFRVRIGEHSKLSQKITIDAIHPYIHFETHVNWQENHKFLKVEFPVNVLSRQATFEIQYGHIQRPTHFNTSWDWAKYEGHFNKQVLFNNHINLPVRFSYTLQTIQEVIIHLLALQCIGFYLWKYTNPSVGFR